jgi:hypothetical protein
MPDPALVMLVGEERISEFPSTVRTAAICSFLWGISVTDGLDISCGGRNECADSMAPY